MQALTSASKEVSERPRTSGNSVCRVQHSEGGVKSKLLITAISFPWIFRASASYCSELRFPSTSVAGVFRSACRAASCGSMLFFQLRVRSLQLGVWFSHADFELVAVNEGSERDHSSATHDRSFRKRLAAVLTRIRLRGKRERLNSIFSGARAESWKRFSLLEGVEGNQRLRMCQSAAAIFEEDDVRTRSVVVRKR